MNRRFIRATASLFLVFVFAFSFCLPAFAQEQRVFDSVDLLSDSERGELEQTIRNLREKLSVDLVVVLTNSTEGKTPRAYADDYYDNGGFGTGADKSGALLLIDMGNRQIYISTCGSVIDFLTDSRIDSLLGRISPKVKKSDYAGAVQAFLDGAESYIKSGAPNGQYRYDESTGEITKSSSAGLTTKNVLLFAVMAAGVGLISAGSVAAKYKFGFKKNTYPMKEKSHMRMKDQRDVFLYKNVTSRRIETDNNNHGGGSGGGSSTHSSSSGTTHGGGGTGF